MKKYDKQIAFMLFSLTVIFVLIASINKDFLDWIFARHHNQLSWYIRPLFLLPFCYFAFKRSWAGIMGTIFLLTTSMAWFPVPETINAQVKEFLQYEVDYLTGDWGVGKILITLLVPFSLTALALAFWKRNLWIGLTVLVLIAVGKMTWSVTSAGDAGKSIFIPALVGLFLCIFLIYWGFKKAQKKNDNQNNLKI
ncbi:hypothetical protein SM124_13895 [Bacillus sp. 31A1R]|uniref:Uncharacterized protein n=1 Tax=Robertmurraya mangrovi TaxID=3098077 RepID=A0ABU5J076_9BACI|nr:hypothetical protein [Bacillus sp. 31A1R]MDZ5472820.1 hypothetical protein [Bacillus sp. 31A1R]